MNNKLALDQRSQDLLKHFVAAIMVVSSCYQLFRLWEFDNLPYNAGLILALLSVLGTSVGVMYVLKVGATPLTTQAALLVAFAFTSMSVLTTVFIVSGAEVLSAKDAEMNEMMKTECQKYSDEFFNKTPDLQEMCRQVRLPNTSGN